MPKTGWRLLRVKKNGECFYNVEIKPTVSNVEKNMP